MTRAYVVTGTLIDGTTLQLDEPLPAGAGRVRVTVEAADPAPSAGPKPSAAERLAEFRRRQEARGFVPRSAEEIDADVRELRGE